MQLHPLNLSKPDNTTISQPPSPNPLLDTNPFGAVPLSALLQSPPTSLHTKQASRGGDDKHPDSDASVAQTPEGPRRPSAESGRAALEPSVFQRQAALQASSFNDLVKQQVCLFATFKYWHAEHPIPFRDFIWVNQQLLDNYCKRICLIRFSWAQRAQQTVVLVSSWLMFTLQQRHGPATSLLSLISLSSCPFLLSPRAKRPDNHW